MEGTAAEAVVAAVGAAAGGILSLCVEPACKSRGLRDFLGGAVSRVRPHSFFSLAIPARQPARIFPAIRPSSLWPARRTALCAFFWAPCG